MCENYAAITKKIQDAGFYVTKPENMGSWSRITICGESCHPRPGYTGNSFWIAEVNEKWYLGTWGGSIYRATDATRIVDFSISWLSHERHKTMADFDEAFVSKFCLQPADVEFDNLVWTSPPE